MRECRLDIMSVPERVIMKDCRSNSSTKLRMHYISQAASTDNWRVFYHHTYNSTLCAFDVAVIGANEGSPL
ncbi:hypothetical protein PHMEG_00034315 [Phytophthora megakarya]|uniref:Uncharacterized protein n=1 Tax=Phytophthora megakarya TaxID=4795 RepID=A0A225UTV5_9STRA|nr:hypothetical protein PHMEG_00034315 [Phytophthora megakarya]